MNYNALEGLIQNILASFHCDACKSKASKEQIEIKNIEENSVTIAIQCRNCEHVSYIKSEVMSIDLTKYLAPNEIELLKNSFENSSISDEEIVAVHKTLKKSDCSVDDFLN